MIKTIIFDFDQTIYVGNIGDNNKMHDRDMVGTCFGEGVYDYLDKKYNISKKDIKDIVDICKEEGMDYIKLANTFNEKIFIHKIEDKIEILPNEFFEKISKNHNLYIVSMSPLKYLEHYFNLYKINKSCFKELLSMNLLKDNSKSNLFEFVMKKENNNPNEMLVIGDNFFHDVEPAIKLGLNTLHFKGDFNEIYNFMTEHKISDCEEFKNIRKFIYKNK